MPTRQPEEKFVKVYEPTETSRFKYTVTVRHQGTVLAFAMDERRRIYYSVLNLERQGVSSPLDVNYWDNDPLELRFPDELGQVGARAAGLHRMPVVLKNGALADATDFVEASDIDFFRSTTARLTADAPFQLFSDGEYLYLFRQGVSATDRDHNIFVAGSEGEDIAVVDRTLLVDRFLYRNGQLVSKLEVRFQRSRRIDRPASRKDTLGTSDLENKPFFEPTLELALIRNLEDGKFALEMVPTAIPRVQRWQIFAYNSASGRVDSFNIERGEDGLFNTLGTRYYTSPDPTYRNDVFERQPGTCPFTGLPMIPLLSDEGFAEFSLVFSGREEDAVRIAMTPKHGQALTFPRTSLTIECWVKASGEASGTFLSYSHADAPAAFSIGNLADLNIMVMGMPTGPTGISVADGRWHHLAVSWENKDGRIFIAVDGEDLTPIGLADISKAKNLPADGMLTLGQKRVLEGGQEVKSDYFTGQLDEVRLWNRVRHLKELHDEKSYRLIGNENDLVGYWRFDEGGGDAIHDQSDQAYHGILEGREPEDDPQANAWTTERLDETAMVFDGTPDPMRHIYNPFMGFPESELTIEFWMKTDGTHQKMAPLSYANTDTDDAFMLFFNGDLRLAIYGHYSGPTKLNTKLRDGAWHHVAVTWSNTSGIITVYLDGRDITPSSLARIQLDRPILNGGSLVLGHEQDALGGDFDQPFYGEMNDLRIWNRVRSASEIFQDKDRRIDTFRPDLVFIMQSGAQSRWTYSDAPVGDHPGVRRSSFAIEGRKVGAGMSARFYYQQEKMATGYRADDAKPMKRTARLMLVVATTPAVEDDTEDYIAALDFGISKAGRLAQIPDRVSLDVIDRPGGSFGGESVDGLLEQLRLLREEQGLHISQIENTGTELSFSTAYADEAAIDQTISRVNEEITALGGDADPDEALFEYDFDAAFLEEGKGYVFLRGELVLRTDMQKQTLASYPRPIVEEWPELPQEWHAAMDAAYSPVPDVYAFFKGNAWLQYRRVEANADDEAPARDIIEMGPELIKKQFPDLPEAFQSGLDAVHLLDGGMRLGMFKGDQYLTQVADGSTPPGAPSMIQDRWPGLPTSWYKDGFDAATIDGDELLVFRDYEYVSFALSDEIPVLQGDPILVDNDSWPGVIHLFGITDDELTEEEKRLQQFYYLKEKLQQLAENYEQIEKIKADIHSDVALRMPLVHLDPEGHWLAGALLGFAWTADAPQLFESVNGRMNLYFRGKKDQFFVSYFDLLTGRARYPVATDADDGLDIVARISGPDGDGIGILIADGSSAKVCTVSVENPALGVQERWLEVPREVRRFVDVINGTDDTYDYTAFAQGYPGYFKPQNGSRLITAISSEAGGVVSNGQAARHAEPSRASQWFAASPGNAMSLAVAGAHAGTTDTDVVGKFSVKGDVCMEAWLNPAHTSNEVARVVHHASGTSAYMLGLLKSGDSLTAKAFAGSTADAIIIPNFKNFPSDAITIEFWSQAEDIVGAREGTPFSYATANHNNQFTLFDHKNLALWVTDGSHTVDTGVNLLDLSSRQLQPFYQALKNPWIRAHMVDLWNRSVGRSRWHHFAVTWQSSDGRVQIYKDGALVFSGTAGKGLTLSSGGTLVFGQDQDVPGGKFDAKQALKGAMDEMRVWRVVRSKDEINEHMRTALSGDESGLAGYWKLEGDRAVDLTKNKNDGSVSGDLKLISSPVQHFVGLAGVGNRYVKTTESVPPNRWQHLAASYNQSYALDFDGINDIVDCGSDVTLDLSGDLTLEAVITLKDRNEQRGILTKGKLADGTDQAVPYSLRVNKAGRLVFSFEDEGGAVKEFVGPEKSWRLVYRNFAVGFPIRIPTFEFKPVPVLAKGKTYRVAVTRKKERDTEEKKDSDGNLVSVNVREWWDINYYIDGEPAGYLRYEGTIGSNNDPVEIGRAYDYQTRAFAYFKGQISEVRVWNQAIDGKDTGQEIRGNEKGLVSWWRFEANEGNIAFDAKSTNHGSRKGPAWVKNPDPQASKIFMYINGASVGTVNAAAQVEGQHQFTIGGCRDDNGMQDGFAGWIDEVRVWKSARTQEQIQDNLFRRLIGEREHLVAHYDADRHDADQLKDQSGRGLHLNLIDSLFILSSAPISDESATVRNALAGIKNDFHDQTHSRPAVQEYGDVQYGIDGNMIGVMKRCYSYIKNGAWTLVTGFKIGDLEMEWIGQAQYDPQLIGFIEGAPPVPSENLTIRLPDKGQNYEKVSTVELKSAESTLQSYSITTDRGVDTSISIKAGLGFKSETEAGFGVTTSVEDTNILVGVKGHMETSNSWIDEQMVGSGGTTTRLSRLDVQGAWENASGVKYPKMGRRYIPKNVGFALVQSETADVFAMRLKHPDPEKRVVVGLRMQPNPDIPKDWNIIIFPMNNRYVKQGTLDGKIGLEPDREDYPNALTYSSNVSYFKPIEAYALKNRIEREREAQKLIYQNYDASPAGASGLALGAGIGGGVGLALGGPVGAVAGALAGAGVGSTIAGATAKQKLPDLSRRNMVNTYVWTADGGLFAESEETMDVMQEVVGGNFSLSGMAGLFADVNTAISKVAVSFELEAMMGGHLNLTNQKQEDSSSSFEVIVDLDVERDVHVQSQAQADLVGKPGMFDAGGNPVKAPGKVDAYRFMSFYLKPDKEHFKDFKNKVIDQEWLNSNDPNAVALSQAIAKENGSPWRVMHRVTFVSRVLPEIDAPEATPTDETLKAANIESNYELIRRVEPYVVNKTGNYQEFTDAVRDAIRRYLPELSSAEDDIVDYMVLYFQVFEG